MKKKFIAIILIIMMILLSSCGKANNDNAKIQIWCYDFGNAGYYSSAVASIMASSKLFCEKNGIQLEIVRYDEKTLSHDDYVIKRNAAAANGNMIIIEDARFMHDIAMQHADYTELDNYDSLLGAYKDKYCIPLGVGYRSTTINNDAINYYGINTDKPIITYNDYLEIKQQMKEKGARFRVNLTEFSEILDYHIENNGLKFVNYDSDVLKDNNKFKKSLKSAIISACDDFILYNYGYLNVDDVYSKNESGRDYVIYDENSELTIYDNSDIYSLAGYNDVSSIGETILNKTVVIDPESTFLSPCFYMYKKITNNKIYDLANHIVNETSYLYATERNHFYSPVFDKERTREILELDENWEYNGAFKINAERGQEKDAKMYKLVNDTFEMLVKDEETSKLIASYYYVNREYSNKISSFVANILSELSKEKFNYKDEEINKTIDNKIDEFITNFNVHYN